MDDELFRIMADILGCEKRLRYWNPTTPFCKAHGGNAWPCLESSMAAARFESSPWARTRVSTRAIYNLLDRYHDDEWGFQEDEWRFVRDLRALLEEGK
jgi:hypothetical protein